MRRSAANRADGEQRVLQVIQRSPAISVDVIASEANYARCTVQRIIVRLIHQNRLTVRRGAGRKPNSYEVIQT